MFYRNCKYIWNKTKKMAGLKKSPMHSPISISKSMKGWYKEKYVIAVTQNYQIIIKTEAPYKVSFLSIRLAFCMDWSCFFPVE